MTYSIEIKNIVINNLINKTKKTDICKLLNISMNTINSWEYQYQENINNKIFLNTTNLNKQKHGLNKINDYTTNIIDYVNNNEGCTLKNIRDYIDNKLSYTSICRILKENNITRKKIQNRIVCKNIDKINEDRTNFANNSDNDNFSEYISIDESSFCVNDLQRYGYSIFLSKA